ncbi:TPA: WGR domain-containing protein, partial [Escherichia coli]|nr:WGR domain-containing protein [Escherichia coli]
MKTYIYQDEKSHKFWAVEQQGNELHINWGKVGSNGQSQVKSFADAAAAEKAELKLVAEKVKKGYVDDGSPETIINSPISSTVSVQELAISTGNFTTTETAQPQAMPTLETPPWLKNGESIVIFANAEPAPFSHRHLINDPLDIVDKDGFFWIQLKEYPYWAAFYLACLQKFDVSQCQSEWQLALQETISRIQKLQQDGSLFSDVILTLTRLIIGRPGRPHTWLDSIVQLRGLEYATELVIAMQHVQMTDDANTDPTKNATLKLHYNSLFSALRRGEMADNYYLPVV